MRLLENSKIIFIIDILKFAIPFLISLSIFYIPYFYVGEELFISYRIDKAIEKSNNYLIGFKTNENERIKYLKYNQIILKKPETVAIGSSRVLQFRNNMFTTNFYNMGYTINTINDVLPYIEFLKNLNVKNVILGLDFWQFNPEWIKKQENKQTNIFTKLPFINYYIFSDFKKPYEAIKYLFVRTTSNYETIIGLNAYEGNGIRNDGSYDYGTLINKLQKSDSTIKDYNFKDTFGRITNKNRRFEKFNEVSVEAIKTLNQIISLCKQNNIHLILIWVPLADAVYDKMTNDKDYLMLQKMPLIIDEIAKKQNINFIQIEKFSTVGESDQTALDGFHGSERVYGKVALKVAEKDSVMRQFINIPLINENLKKEIRYNIFD